jgi:uncharacterized protein YegL
MSTPANIQASIIAAGLPQAAATELVNNLNNTVLMGCVGTAVDDLDATEATLVSVVLDMSSSMSGYQSEVITAYNTMLDALKGSKAAASIMLSTWTFSDSPNLLHGYLPVGQVQKLSTNEYSPNGMTALYDTVMGTMTGIVSYGQKLLDNGVPNRRIIFVLSDGGDNRSKARAGQVKTASQGLITQEAYTLAYAGFGSSDLKQIADDIGFPEVITTSASESEIRKIFHQVSQSIIRVSQGATAGGFF